jgi:hypothetical protein
MRREVSLVPLVQSHQLQIMQKVIVVEDGGGAMGKELPGSGSDKASASAIRAGGPAAAAGGPTGVVTSHYFFPLSAAVGGAAGAAAASPKEVAYPAVLRRWLHLAATER